MAERRTDSGRELLEELEDGWGTPRAPSVAAEPAAPAVDPPEERAFEDDEITASEAAKVDEGWLDDLFPGGEEDEPEPELPDEGLDPIAFAEAKRARDERVRQKRERRKARADAKRARQKARADAMKARQKPKSKKARAAAASAPPTRATRAAEKVARAPAAEVSLEASPGPAITKTARPKAPVTKPSTLGSIKLLAIVLAVLLAGAAVAAALVK